MKSGQYVRLTAPVKGDELGRFLIANGSTREAYVRVEGDKGVLYLVTRDTDRPENGRIFASITIPLLPEEV